MVIPAHDRVTGLALAEDRLELALVVTADSPPEQMAGALGTADEHAQFAGTPEERCERCGALEDDVGGQFHLGHAVAVAWRQRCAFSRAEDGDQPAHPV